MAGLFRCPLTGFLRRFRPGKKRERRGFPHRSRKEGGVGYLVYFVGREVSMVILLPSAAVMPLSLVTAAVMIA